MTLFINACVRKDSRTRRIAAAVLEKAGNDHTELRLSDMVFPTVDEAFLEKRGSLAAQGRYDDPILAPAVQFAAADRIVIAAPFWDLSFPAVLKQYLEQITVVGITFRYNAQGQPEGLCKARELYYVTTAGGTYFPEEFGFGYVRALAQSFFGIESVKLIKAVGLDIFGADENAIIAGCLGSID